MQCIGDNRRTVPQARGKLVFNSYGVSDWYDKDCSGNEWRCWLQNIKDILNTLELHLKIMKMGTEAMAQWLSTLVVLAEDLGSIPRNSMAAHNYL